MVNMEGLSNNIVWEGEAGDKAAGNNERNYREPVGGKEDMEFCLKRYLDKAGIWSWGIGHPKTRCIFVMMAFHFFLECSGCI